MHICIAQIFVTIPIVRNTEQMFNPCSGLAASHMSKAGVLVQGIYLTTHCRTIIFIGRNRYIFWTAAAVNSREETEVTADLLRPSTFKFYNSVLTLFHLVACKMTWDTLSQYQSVLRCHS
jgi:hypothetical protein